MFLANYTSFLQDTAQKPELEYRGRITHITKVFIKVIFFFFSSSDIKEILGLDSLHKRKTQEQGVVRSNNPITLISC